MVGNRNHSLKPCDQIDDSTLEAYVLGQLLPDDEQGVRRHLETCPLCQQKATELRTLLRQIADSLHHELDRSHPGPKLSFDQTLPEWRKPPRRTLIRYRIARLLPGAPVMALIGVFATVFLFVFSSNNAATLHSLDLNKAYDGPPAVVAASTEEGLVVVQLSPGEIQMLAHVSHVNEPHNLKLSPTGGWLAFQDRQTLYVMELTTDGFQAEFPLIELADWVWSPDGRSLAFTDGTGRLALLDTGSKTMRVLVPASETVWGTPVWSPDGRQIAYAAVGASPASSNDWRWQSVWRVDVETGFRVELARNPDHERTLVVPAAWIEPGERLLGWDVHAAIEGHAPELYWIDAAGHAMRPLGMNTLAQGVQLMWPVSAQATTLAIRDDKLVALYLSGDKQQPIPDQIPWPRVLEWAPNGAWLACTVAGAPEGEGVYVFSLQEGALRSIQLPPGAQEKAVTWAGAEHLFVIRQQTSRSTSQLWLVPLTGSGEPLRVMSSISLPSAGQYNGWRWGDVVAIQIVQFPD